MTDIANIKGQCLPHGKSHIDPKGDTINVDKTGHVDSDTNGDTEIVDFTAGNEVHASFSQKESLNLGFPNVKASSSQRPPSV